MKLRMVLLFAMCLISVDIVNGGIEKKWQAFRVMHNKKFKDSNEEVRRFRVFERNFQRAEVHNKKFYQGRTSFKVKTYKFSDTEEGRKRTLMTEFKMKRRTNKVGIFHSEPLFFGFSGPMMPELPPPSVDWRAQYKVTPSTDQGDCASCYSFSATGAIESQLAIKYGNLTTLSAQYLVDCTKEYGNIGCKGGQPDNVFEYLIAKGCVADSLYPYNGQDGRCPNFPRYPTIKLEDYVQIPAGDELALQEAVWKVGPVASAMDAKCWTFHHYKEGIYSDQNCTSDKLDHSVLVVGYGTEEGKDYWIVRNSWGDDWGENGFFRIKRNYNNHCGIASMASYPVLHN